MTELTGRRAELEHIVVRCEEVRRGDRRVGRVARDREPRRHADHAGQAGLVELHADRRTGRVLERRELDVAVIGRRVTVIDGGGARRHCQKTSCE
jgi:hypothetical protein